MYNLELLPDYSGNGVGMDVERAIRLYKRAFHEGAHVSLIYTLGFLLEKGGNGVEKDV